MNYKESEKKLVLIFKENLLCKNDNYSKTACGFVIEFEDIITKHAMNSGNTNVGGYPASSMHTYVNNEVYDEKNRLFYSDLLHGVFPLRTPSFRTGTGGRKGTAENPLCGRDPGGDSRSGLSGCHFERAERPVYGSHERGGIPVLPVRCQRPVCGRNRRVCPHDL